MRHYRRGTFAPTALTGSMPMGSTATTLVANPSPAHRLAAALRGTLRCAILIAPVAFATDAHLLLTAGAVVKSIRRFAGLHARRPKDWTTPCNAGIKTIQTGLQARAEKARGFLPRNVPGPSLIWRLPEHSAGLPGSAPAVRAIPQSPQLSQPLKQITRRQIPPPPISLLNDFLGPTSG